MYEVIHDLFINVLGYSASEVDINTTVDAGRADVIVRTPTGLMGLTSWRVVDAKTRHPMACESLNRSLFFTDLRHATQHLQRFFPIESANLILARILLLRFIEDHGYFAHPTCIREYFDDAERANAVESVALQLSRYDFKTVRGDILTGIYDRFLDRATRKKSGEFYTPPSIARYMIKRVGLRRGDHVLDPACGSGTFLIEAFMEFAATDREQGVAKWEDVSQALAHIWGNDLNTSSATIAQIQLLWQILVFKDHIRSHGLPRLQISGRVNALLIEERPGTRECPAELDAPRYAAVVGNPPFVRAERRDQRLDARTIGEFQRGSADFPGISPKLNSYALFLYRALHSWARPQGSDAEPAGRVAFIVPLSLFDSNETAEFRRLFAPAGRWTLKEIVDLELIYRDIFDADVLPVIVICENRPPADHDLVSVRIATRECVRPQQDGSLPAFELESLPESHLPYARIFTPDQRILTRLTTERAQIVGKLWSLDRLGSAARQYWVARRQRRMIVGGIALRGTSPTRPGGLDVYKAENIIAGEVQGKPVMRDCDVAAVNDPSIWRYPELLPERAFAIAQVAHCPNAAPFDPRKAAFTNTATIFVPAPECANFPFDLLFLSRPYIYFYAIAARMGVLRLCRSHIYPTNLAQLPWSRALLDVGPDIEALRGDVVAALDRLDAFVAKALGLTAEELRKLQLDCATDPFLRQIVPRYPGTQTRKQGFRAGLDSAGRYGVRAVTGT
jgi:hypothetical protein